MLYLIGLGLGDAEDITCKGLKVVKRAKRVFLESYTSIMCVGKDNLEKFYGRDVIVADREMVESNSDEIFRDAVTDDIAFLVVGDPLGATTHTDLILRAKELNIPCSVVPNTSIITAVGCCGLQLYRFGETASIVMWNENWEPDSFVDKIESNLQRGLHTLCLLDIKMHEQSTENLIRGRKIYEPPSFLTVDRAATQLLTAIQRRKAAGSNCILTESTICVGLARIGSPEQRIVSASLCEFPEIDLGPPLHSLIITGEVHPLEQEMLIHFASTATSVIQNVDVHESV